MPELKSIHDLKHHIRKLARDRIVDIGDVLILDEKMNHRSEQRQAHLRRQPLLRIR